MQASTSTAAEKAKQKEDIIKEIKASTLQYVEEVKKEKARADAAEQAVKVLQKSLQLTKKNATAAKVILDDLRTENDTLNAEVQMPRDLRVKDQASIAQWIDDSNEVAIDNALYRLWSTNPGVLDLRFLREELEPTMAQWKVRLEQEANEIVTKVVDSDGEEEIDSTDLKTAQARLDALRKDVHVAFQEVAPAEPEIPATVPNVQPTTDDAPPAENVAQP